ncbi:MAG: hypothetical protein K2Q01_02990, partial [Rickettsiales bacterium]|nr:hypothetical protein [Rickettsiales bacterium]
QAMLCLLMLCALAVRFPMRLEQYSNHYIDSAPKLARSLAAQAEKPALIFMDREHHTHKEITTAARDFRKVAHTYPPRDEDTVIFAHFRTPEENKAVALTYPGRYLYAEEKGVLVPLAEGDIAP